MHDQLSRPCPSVLSLSCPVRVGGFFFSPTPCMRPANGREPLKKEGPPNCQVNELAYFTTSRSPFHGNSLNLLRMQHNAPAKGTNPQECVASLRMHVPEILNEYAGSMKICLEGSNTSRSLINCRSREYLALLHRRFACESACCVRLGLGEQIFHGSNVFFGTHCLAERVN